MALARVRYAARRGLEVIPTLFFVSIIVFGLIRLTPGDPAAMKMGREAARPENKPKLEALRHETGLDRPIPVQYVFWLNDLAHGNFDTSLRSKRPTLDLFLQKLPATVELVIVATLFALFVSLPLGVIAGYRGGALDSLLMRIQDALLAFPAVLFAILVVAAIGASKTSIILTIGVSYPPRLARLVRGNMMLLKHEDFVTASRASGSGDGRLIWRHILPNCFATIMVQVTPAMAVAILIETGLSYLGLGVQPPTTTWGTMLKAAQSYPDQAPWYVLAPGICIFAVVLALNTLGDVLRDRLDPRLRRLKKEFAMPLADRLAA